MDSFTGPSVTKEDGGAGVTAGEHFSGYTLLEPLGEGGMGQVFRARSREGHLVALKRLRVTRHVALATALFEREYYTLAELTHPRVVEVYDYGVHDGMPYYTMELLDGSDLQECAPLPWPEACRVLSDIASSLSLLHSRRLVHRDLSPRNVRRTTDGRAKLIDFGALCHMGTGQPAVGTPPYCAPELINGEPLDARADLFGLGALLYWSITARHAFPARTIQQLPDVWRTRPPVPSRVDSDVPSELDALTMQLLDLDRAGRPQSAAEVIARLNAIAGLSDESVEAAHAYLVTPALVGRDTERIELRRHALGARAGRGGVVLIQGAPRSGRTRLLKTCVIEAKLAGMAALWAAPDEADDRPLSLLRRLSAALVEMFPGEARRRAAVCGDFLDALLSESTSREVDAADDPRYAEAVADWLRDLSNVQPLALVVDDFDRCDPVSAAVVGHLSLMAEQAPILVVVSSDLQPAVAARGAVEQVARSAERIELSSLSESQTTELLGSLFGSISNLTQAAVWAHNTGGGLPGATIALAQHLADSGIARFAEGSWTLPDRLSEFELPESFGRMMALRFDGLSQTARTLAQLLSLVEAETALSLQDCLELLRGEGAPREAHRAIDELVRAEVLIAGGTLYGIRDHGLLQVVRQSIDDVALVRLHEILASHYRARGRCELATAYHELEGGRVGAALARVLETINAGVDIESHDGLFGRTAVAIDMFERLLRHAQESQLSPGQIYPLRKVLVQLASVRDPGLAHYADETLLRLKADSGWLYFQEYEELDPADRLGKAYERARATYDAAPESERGLPPLEAIKELATTTILVSGINARIGDTSRIFELPRLLEPFVPLAPVVQLLFEFTLLRRRANAHNLRVHEQRSALLDRLSQPIDGMDELSRQGAHHILSYYHSLENALACNSEALRAAEALEQAAAYVPLAWQVRMIYHLARADRAEAERCRQRRNLAALQREDADHHLIRSLDEELLLAHRGSDLLTIKQLLPRIQAEAVRFPGWRLWEAFGQACYAWILDDQVAALQHCERGLEAMHPNGHWLRTQVEGLYAQALAACGEVDRARGVVAAADERVRDAGGQHRDPIPLEIALAKCDAQAGSYDLAITRVQRQIDAYRSVGGSGVTLAYLNEQKALLATEAKQEEVLEEALADMAAVLGDDTNLRGRLDHLIERARLAGLVSSAPAPESDTPERASLAGVSEAAEAVNTILGGDAGHAERAARVLAFVVTTSGASGGHLYQLRKQEPVLLRSEGLPPPSADLEVMLRSRVRALWADDELVTATVTDSGGSPTLGPVDCEDLQLHIFVLHADSRHDFEPSGLLILGSSPNQAPTVGYQTLTALGAGLASMPWA